MRGMICSAAGSVGQLYQHGAKMACSSASHGSRMRLAHMALLANACFPLRGLWSLPDAPAWRARPRDIGRSECEVLIEYSASWCAAVSMKADGFQVPAGVKKALAPAVAALSVAAPAFAEGTGEVRLLLLSYSQYPFLSAMSRESRECWWSLRPQRGFRRIRIRWQ
jgi:hypothetical protein